VQDQLRQNDVNHYRTLPLFHMNAALVTIIAQCLGWGAEEAAILRVLASPISGQRLSESGATICIHTGGHAAGLLLAQGA